MDLNLQDKQTPQAAKNTEHIKGTCPLTAYVCVTKVL